MIRTVYLFLLTAFFAMFPTVAQSQEEKPLNLLPYPVDVAVGDGSFVFTSKTVIAMEDENMEPVAKEFAQLFMKAAGFSPKLKVKSKKGDVYIRKDETVKDEGYVLDVKPEKIVIGVANEKGAFYALQTLRQLLPSAIEGDLKSEGVTWSVPVVCITDEPRFSYRGLMVDVARFFIPKEQLLRIIDTMGMLKLNKLHLHLTDDNGWRLEIKKYPLLVAIGSKTVKRRGKSFPERKNARQGEPLVDGGYYTQEDMKEIISYAGSRQIEIIPEIAMPGHSSAALAAYPMLACPVNDKYLGVVPGLGDSHTNVVYCAGNDEVFTFLERVIDEMVELFPSQYIHIGGDAIKNTHWEKCPLCRERMKKERLDDEKGLLGYFMQRIDRYVRGKGRTLMGWEEVMDANLSRGAVVFDWHGYGHGAVKAGKQGHRFVMSPTGTMYLNRYQGPQWQEPVLAFSGGNTLKNIYHYEPIERYWTMSMRSNLLGMEAALWTEFCNSSADVDYLLYPRLGAVAEAAWSAPISKKWNRFVDALDDCIMRWTAKGIKPSMSMYNVKHEVVADFGNLKVALECTRPDVEIRYTTDGREPDRYSSLYRKPWVVKESQVIKCAAFKDGKRMGQVLVLPIEKGVITGKNLVRSNRIEKRVLNGVRGSLKNTDGEWASWESNDSIALTFDVGVRKRLAHFSMGYLNDYGLAIHKPQKVELWLSDNDVQYWKVAEEKFGTEEVFREGNFKEDLEFAIDGTARYVRLIMRGAGNCPQWHVRPTKETQVYIDEVRIE